MGTLEPEGIRLRSALPLLGVLPPEEVVRLLRQRASVLSAENTAMRAALRRRFGICQDH